jgi:hypothetical protein
MNVIKCRIVTPGIHIGPYEIDILKSNDHAYVYASKTFRPGINNAARDVNQIHKQ